MLGPASNMASKHTIHYTLERHDLLGAISHEGARLKLQPAKVRPRQLAGPESARVALRREGEGYR